MSEITNNVTICKTCGTNLTEQRLLQAKLDKAVALFQHYCHDRLNNHNQTCIQTGKECSIKDCPVIIAELKEEE